MSEKLREAEDKKGEEAQQEEIFIEIPKEEWEKLQTIARRVGGDFGMKVEQGPPFLEQRNPLTGETERVPYVAYENTAERSITVNPLFVIEHPRKAQRIAAHEGAHRAITRGTHEIGLPKETALRLGLGEYLGFHSFNNIGLEDPRVNTWDTAKFPGLILLNKEVYDEQLREENAKFIAPEVNLIISRLGRYPRYAEAASELMRFWHLGQYSGRLKPEVEKFLRRTQNAATRYWQTLPPTNRALHEPGVVEKARECFRIYHEEIWPEVKKLVEMDLRTEEQRQMVNEFLQKQKELNQKKQELDGARKQGDNEKQNELQKEIDRLNKELDPFKDLTEDAKKELLEEINKAVREAVEKLSKEIDEKEAMRRAAEQKQAELLKEIKDLEKRASEASGDEKEALQNEIKKKQGEKLANEMKAKQAELDIKKISEALKNAESEEGAPFPEDALSEETKAELQKLFKRLPAKKRAELRDKAERQLEQIEDGINKEMDGRLNEDNPKSHEERRAGEDKKRDAAQKSRAAKEDRDALERKFEQLRVESMSDYEKIRREVSGLIDHLYFRLRQIFRPEEYGGEEAGYPQGARPDMSRAMQAERDVAQKQKLFIRETAPEKISCRFWHLIDLSGSMSGEKIMETVKGFAAMGEALDRLEDLNSGTAEIHQGITGFHNRVFEFKEMRERFTRDIESKLGAMLERVKDQDAGTNTYLATVIAYEKMKDNLGKTGNYILTYTDGAPNYDVRDKLREFLSSSKEERERLKIKIGLVWLGEADDEALLQALMKNYGYDLGIVMSAVKPSPEEHAKGKKDFAEKLADLLEDVVKNPDKY
ncbi:MAG: hypothetical protein HYT12_00350 [Candidatus Liptonbacteria bacterium]|nr:hypothetical protein [Candidatus Liptonbacteria bacterium]